ncbi:MULTISPECIES: hypothetical protein [Marichromatium]|uniref:Uncharacterized protein n=1 Tax=Marichromatium gracile TaxID=1048 RepID=A0A4R4ADV6_MARGR|nr:MULTISPECIES: hypothetical protein [Marichromatium]TCW37155.1 hypothetical protein EDC29_103354 [Marichromatium gracile]
MGILGALALAAVLFGGVQTTLAPQSPQTQDIQAQAVTTPASPD